ncbi:hypothetical protein [Arthrobacter sp. STN4]|uniref:hypothetical protein n=1 Tax=Arthrobacter sp. STN4 TaxID=2923276 RepID=UPI00211A41C4|nr:hypothetical protein [Arthrobacter sp. STN4]MCQ9162994.1 hypothetical protein [Arthrobacter sp. STN4]
MASTTSFDRIAEIRARHRPTPPPPAAKRPKMGVAVAALRQLVFELAHEAGLADALLGWVQDAAEAVGETPPDHVEVTPEHVAMAAELLIEKLIGSHPWLRQDKWDMDAPVWSDSFVCPPGLVMIGASDSLRSKILIDTGCGRLMAPVVHLPMTVSPREMRRWLVPTEVASYFEEHLF